jgi:hypothetical protein
MNDFLKDSIEGCPGSYEPKSEICKECTMNGDCRREFAEDLAANPEKLGQIMAQAQVVSSKILQKEMEDELKKKMEELPRASLGDFTRGVINIPKPDIDGFLNLFLQFYHKLQEKDISDPKGELFKLFLTTPSYQYDGIEPPPPPPPPEPEPPPPTPEQVEQDALKTNMPEYCYKCATGGFAYRDMARFPEGEKIISRSPEYAYKYAANVLGKPWPEAESTIRDDAEYAYLYAKDMLKGPFLGAEYTIAHDSNPEWAFKYARTILGKRWPEAEEAIFAHPVWGREYKDYFKIKTEEKE